MAPRNTHRMGLLYELSCPGPGQGCAEAVTLLHRMLLTEAGSHVSGPFCLGRVLTRSSEILLALRVNSL